MTRIALISDIHANEVALRAVLAEIHRTGVDQVICLGDVAEPRKS
jgi:predicted phosphodiesterase